MLQVELKIFDNDYCSSYYKPANEYPRGIIETQMCVGDPDSTMDTCQV